MRHPGRTRHHVVRVRYAETDKMGVVYYAHYLVWFEIGRTDWLRETGWTYRAMEAEGLGAAGHRGALRVQGERALRRRDRDPDDGATGVAGPAGVRLRWSCAPADRRLVASGYTVHVSVDRAGRPVRLPARVKELLA